MSRKQASDDDIETGLPSATQAITEDHGEVSSSFRQVMREEEIEVRRRALKNPMLLVIVDLLSALIVFLLNLVTIEMIISVILSVVLTVYIHNRVIENPSNVDGTYDGTSLDFVILSFAVITPIANSITMAFGRRERAVENTALLRSALLQIYTAHVTWDWGLKPGVTDTSGRTESSVDWLVHSDRVVNEILMMGSELSRYLSLPSTTRARHKVMPLFKRESVRTTSVSLKLYKSMMTRLGKLADLCEILKREGMPANEASRIRQYELFVLQNIERLRTIKLYRTPQALRSYGRLFSICLPPFYSPYYAQLAASLDSIGMGIAFAVLVSVALTGMFETVAKFEDPFIPGSFLDGVQVKREFVTDFTPQLLALRQHYFAKAKPFRLESGECPIDKSGENAETYLSSMVLGNLKSADIHLDA